MEWNPYIRACPTRFVLDRVADKWTVLLLGVLDQGPRHFNDLRREVDGLSQKMLSQTLKNLERDGLVIRTVHATAPVTVEYALTPLGRTLTSSLENLRQWAVGHIETILEAQQAYDARTEGGGIRP